MKKFTFYIVSVLASLLLALPFALTCIYKKIYSLEGLFKLNYYWSTTDIIKLSIILIAVAILTILTIKCAHIFINGAPLLSIRMRFFEYTHTFKIRFFHIAKLKWIFPVVLIVTSLIVIQSMMGPHHISFKMRWFEKHHLVAHAAGGIDGITYTNCLEAFEENYQKGHRVFEFDICFTADNIPVAEHDWLHYFRQIGKDYVTEANTPPVTYAEFMQGKLNGEYTPLDVKDIINLMATHKDIYIMTDFKHWYDKERVTEAFSQIVSIANETNHPEVLDRIIVQIYHYEFFDWVNSVYKFDNYLFTCYAASEEERKIQNLNSFCTKNNIPVIATHTFWYTKQDADIALKSNIRMYVHTINDLSTANEYILNGVSGIYTDFITPAEIIAPEMNKK